MTFMPTFQIEPLNDREIAAAIQAAWKWPYGHSRPWAFTANRVPIYTSTVLRQHVHRKGTRFSPEAAVAICRGVPTGPRLQEALYDVARQLGYDIDTYLEVLSHTPELIHADLFGLACERVGDMDEVR